MKPANKKKPASKKHRLYIDVTYSSYIGMREAAKGLQLLLDERVDLQKEPVWLYEGPPYIDKLKIVEPTKRKL